MMVTTLSSASPGAAVAPVDACPASIYPPDLTFADVQQRLGGIPPERIHLYPWPGLATEQDVIEVRARTGRLCELLDGILVEKPMGFYESVLALALGDALRAYLQGRNLGIAAGEAGMLRIGRNRIRIPDVSFIRWERLPPGRDPVPAVCPDLAVEVLSESNTEQEMQGKLDEYFAGGAQLVWIIDPRTRTARSYRGPGECTLIDPAGSLTGGDLLPGFVLRLQDLFAELDRPQQA